MKLDKRIYQLRTERNLSQGDLAEALDVSRQSVSKWETGASVPDLDKLVRMSELFHVTLDDLVNGSDSPASPSCNETEPPAPSALPEAARLTHPRRWIVGIALLSISAVLGVFGLFAGGFFGMLLLPLPFALCGAICLLVQRPLLWCLWTLYFLARTVLQFCTSGSPGAAIAFLKGYMPFGFPALSGFLTILILFTLMGFTIAQFAKNSSLHDRRNLILSASLYLCLLAGFHLLYLWDPEEFPLMNLQWAISFLLVQLRVVCFTMTCIFGLRLLRKRRKQS